MHKRIYKNICLISLLGLIITLAVTSATMYTNLNGELKKGVIDKALLTAQFIKSGADLNMINESVAVDSILVADEDGNVLYSSNKKESRADLNAGDIKSAIETGTGESLEKIGRERVYNYSLKLDGGKILRVTSRFSDFFSKFLITIIPILAIVFLVYILSAAIAIRAAASIVKPIGDVLNGELDKDSAQYSELLEIAQKIKSQDSQIQGQKQKLSSQKAQLKVISKNMHEGLVVLEADGNIAMINDRGAQIFQNAAEGLKYTNFFALEGADLLHDEFLDVMEKGAKSITRNINGKMYDIYFSPITDAESVSIGAMLILIDVDKKYEAETVRREFCANVSHELKTPLTTILGYSQIINRGVARQEDIVRFTQKIESETTRLIAIVEDIIKLSSLDEDEQEENVAAFTSVRLLDIAHDTKERLSDEANKRNIKINVFGTDSHVMANGVQISEMMYNLADNAVKYNKEGGKVDICVFMGGFYVSDTGIGIDAENYDRIFERFYRVDKSRSRKVNGTGLGLSIVKHIANIHDAAITVSSEPEGGTKFTVQF